MSKPATQQRNASGFSYTKSSSISNCHPASKSFEQRSLISPPLPSPVLTDKHRIAQDTPSPSKPEVDSVILSPDSPNLISFESAGAPTSDDLMSRAPPASASVAAAAPPIPPRTRTSSGDPQFFDATLSNPSLAHLRQLSWDYGLSATQLPPNAAATSDASPTQRAAANPAPLSRHIPLHSRHAVADATNTSPLSGPLTAPILVPCSVHNANHVAPSKNPILFQAAASQPANAAGEEAMQRIEQMIAGVAAHAGSYPNANIDALLRRRKAPADSTGGAADDASLAVCARDQTDRVVDSGTDSDRLAPQSLPASNATATSNSNALAIPGHFVRKSSTSDGSDASRMQDEQHDSFERLFGAADAPPSSALDENGGELNATYICESSDSNAESCTADLLQKARADNARKKLASSAEPDVSLPADAAAGAGLAARTTPAGDADSDNESLNSNRLNMSITGLFKRLVHRSFVVDSDSDDEKPERASIDSQRERLTIKDNSEFVGDSESSTPTLPRAFKGQPSTSSRRSFRTPPSTPVQCGGLAGGTLGSFAGQPPEAIPEAAETELAESSGSPLPNAAPDETANGAQPTANALATNGHCDVDKSELSLKTGSGTVKWNRRTYAVGGGDGEEPHVSSAYGRFSNAHDADHLTDGAVAERGDRRFGTGERPNKSHPSRSHHHGGASSSERSLSIALQVLFPFLIAGFGMVVAGIVLEIVRRWQVFQRMRDLDTIVPPLLGLKGNLEMTLASRLSTQANLGHLDDRARLLRMVGGNLALLEAQAICLSMLASTVAVVLGYIARGGSWPGTLFDALFLTASATCTAAVAAFVLGVVMVTVIVVSRKLRINPDNVATPVAGSLGDLTATAVLAFFASVFYKYLYIPGLWWVLLLVVVFALVLTPLFVNIARHNPYTRQVVSDGWIPVVSAVCISNFAGWIYSLAGDMPEMTPFVPVMNGVGGNLAAIQASRLSTALHSVHGRPGFVRLVPLRRDSEFGAPATGPVAGGAISNAAAASASSATDSPSSAMSAPTNNEAGGHERFGRANEQLSEPALSDGGILLPAGSCLLPNPVDTFCHPNWMHSRTARVLLALALPGHVLFALGVFLINRTEGLITAEFFFLYLLAVLIQVMLLLYMTHWLVQLLWRLGKDPDNFAIPYLTALGDVIGTGLLTLAFIILRNVFNIRAVVQYS